MVISYNKNRWSCHCYIGDFRDATEVTGRDKKGKAGDGRS